MTMTRGRKPCTSAGEFEMARPWCEMMKRSAVPSRLVGHISSSSLFHVEIAELHDAELAECDSAPDRSRVLARVRVLRLDARARRVGTTRPWERSLDHVPIRRDDAPVKSGNGQLVAGLRDHVCPGRVQLRIGRSREVRGLRLLRVGLLVRAVVDELLDRQALRELLHPAEMVAVPMRRDQMVDPGHARILGGRHNPVCVADGAGPRVAGVDENRLAGWRHVKDCVPTLDIDDVDLEGPLRV